MQRDARLEFRPGQFLYCFAPLESGEQRRPYSIASAPGALPRIDLSVSKVNPAGVSGWLYDRQPGDFVEVSRALGSFTFRSPPGREVVLVATGTGVAPFRAMLLDLLPHDERPFTLILGSSRPRNLPYHEELERLANDHSNLRYVPTLTRATLWEWSGGRGWVQEQFLKGFFGRTDLDVYVCGIPRMVEDVKALLRERGVPSNHVFSELYV